MKEQTKKNLKTAATVTGLALGATYFVMRHIAKKQYPDSVYANQPEEQNPVQGRKVVFVENANDPVNADGKQGHLEAVGNSTHIPTFYEKYIKRGFDVVLSFGGLVVLAPVYAVTALAIKADDPGPVFFKQKRVGTDKSYFELLKFRSMSVNTPKDVPTHMLQNGGITKVGAFIRKASIDELPQLWNIFRGNMSVIGPRPALWNQDYLTAERDKYGANDVKPGLTGLAQISGRDELEIPEKAKLDGAYASELKKSSMSGFIMDCKMFFGSIFSVLKHEGVIEGGTGALAKEFNKAHQFDEVDNSFDIANKAHTYSVLMSVYKNDDPDFLARALRSIYEDQTVKPDEIVVVFDGPLTVELYAVLNEYRVGKENVVKYYPQEENHGLGEALRIGSEKCACDYILRMDSDDISDPHRFERQIAYVENHPDIDVLGTDIAEFNTSLDENMRVRSCPEHHDDIVRMGKKRNPMNHVTVCMKKTALKKCGGYKTLLLLEDYYLWLNMIAAGCKLSNIHESLVYVRVGNGFDSKRGSKERITGWKTLQDFMLEHGMINKKEAMMNMLYIRAFNQIAETLNFDIICFANNYSTYDSLKEHTFVDGSPYDYVSLIENASFVCTDSFHTSHFSIIFNRKFCTFERNYGHQNKQSTRIHNLFSTYKCNERFIVDSLIPEEVLNASPNFDVIKETKTKEIQDYLLSSIPQASLVKNEKDLKSEKNCTGCMACVAICPKEAISTTYSEFGYRIPAVDNSKCVQCGLCAKVCKMSLAQSKSSTRDAYQCEYSNDNKPGDITIGDYFEARQDYPELFQKGGILYDSDYLNCLLVNSTKGQELLKTYGNQLSLYPVSRKRIQLSHSNLCKPSTYGRLRLDAKEQYINCGIKGIEKRYTKIFLYNNMISVIQKLAKAVSKLSQVD